MLLGSVAQPRPQRLPECSKQSRNVQASLPCDLQTSTTCSGYISSIPSYIMRHHRRSVLVAALHLCLLALVPSCEEKKQEAPAAAASSAKAAAAPAPAPKPAKPPLKIAFSDWPGWTAFEIGIQKGWFKEAGIEVEFSWMDYLPTMEAFGAGRVDAVMVTNGDALVTGATGGKSKMILVTDYSNGNDKVIAKPG